MDDVERHGRLLRQAWRQGVDFWAEKDGRWGLGPAPAPPPFVQAGLVTAAGFELRCRHILPALLPSLDAIEAWLDAHGRLHDRQA